MINSYSNVTFRLGNSAVETYAFTLQSRFANIFHGSWIGRGGPTKKKASAKFLSLSACFILMKLGQIESTAIKTNYTRKMEEELRNNSTALSDTS
jgi:hypothetical protein